LRPDATLLAQQQQQQQGRLEWEGGHMTLQIENIDQQSDQDAAWVHSIVAALQPLTDHMTVCLEA
jgi:hypothetical protein